MDADVGRYTRVKALQVRRMFVPVILSTRTPLDRVCVAREARGGFWESLCGVGVGEVRGTGAFKEASPANARTGAARLDGLHAAKGSAAWTPDMPPYPAMPTRAPHLAACFPLNSPPASLPAPPPARAP